MQAQAAEFPVGTRFAASGFVGRLAQAPGTNRIGCPGG